MDSQLPAKERGRGVRANLSRLWDDYVRHSTVHGVVYVGGVNCNTKERLVWAAALLLLVSGGYITCRHSLFGDHSFSTTTVITNDHLPVSMFAFPALSLCPLNKVRRTIGERLLLQQLGLPPAESPNATLRAQLTAVMRALSFLEMDQMTNIKPSLARASPLLHRLDGLNLTDFMLQVLPTCRQLFARCTWHDREEDCCDLLHLQQSDLGYCYSFNSLSAIRSKHCKTVKSHGNAIRTFEATMRFSASSRPECELRRTNSYGSGSALQVFLGELNDSDIVTYRMQRGLVVCPHQNIVLPSPSAGFVLPAREARQLELSMTIENTVVDREVLALPLKLRRCTRPGEGTSQLTGTYSADTCKLECKLKYIWNTCHCLPYMFAVMGSIAGLVMGVSMVSGVEALYYLLKTALVLAGPFLDLQGVQHRLQRLPVPRGLHWLHRLRLHRFNLIGRAKRLADGLVKGQWSRHLVLAILLLHNMATSTGGPPYNMEKNMSKKVKVRPPKNLPLACIVSLSQAVTSEYQHS
ncbi:sodium channel protein Nach-like [Frankliniella occidentalis]|uniref:Sodium channel protein Nach-like n=1 Tax=Frankliniella occidentalis TaxID=133901 RepID=A0A6J1TLD3_FRAOC|nr:sodium channel protein Nach-like [Frankliniella occidentalis]